MKEIGDDEPPVNIFLDMGVQLGRESEECLVVHPLEEVFLGSLGIQSVDILDGVFFGTEPVMGRNEPLFVLFGFWMFNRSEWEVSVVGLLIVGLSELITTIDVESSAIDGQLATIDEIFSFHKVFSIGLAWLVQSELSWELGTVQVHSENVFGTIIGVVNFSNIDGVV